MAKDIQGTIIQMRNHPNPFPGRDGEFSQAYDGVSMLPKHCCVQCMGGIFRYTQAVPLPTEKSYMVKHLLAASLDPSYQHRCAEAVCSVKCLVDLEKRKPASQPATEREAKGRTAVPKGHSEVKVDYRGESVFISHIIKFLPISFRFKALHNRLRILIKRSPLISVKLIMNPLLTKIKINILMDAAKNKLYKYNMKALIISSRDTYIII